MSFRAIILDVGGVLFVTLRPSTHAYNQVLREQGLTARFKASDIWTLRGYGPAYRHRDTMAALYAIACSGRSLPELLKHRQPEQAIMALRRQYPLSVRRLDMLTERYKKLRYAKATPLAPNTRKAFQIFKKAGLKIGVFTGSPEQLVKQQLKKKGVWRWVSAFLSEKTVQPKPSPEGLKRMCVLLKVHPKEVVYVADAWPDMRAAKKANIGRVYGVCTTQGRCASLKHLQKKSGLPHKVCYTIYQAATDLARVMGSYDHHA